MVRKSDDEVAVGLAECLGGGRALLGVGDEANVDHLGLELFQAPRDVPGGFLQLRQQVRELGPVGAQAARDEPDARAAPAEFDKRVIGRRGRVGHDRRSPFVDLDRGAVVWPVALKRERW